MIANLEKNILVANTADSKEIHELQLVAFLEQAKIYKTKNLPSLTETYEHHAAEFSNFTYLKVVSDQKIIGSVRGSVKHDICYIGRLIVHPGFQNKGLGKIMMKYIEEKFYTAKRYELFTGHLSLKNIHLYESIGYSIYKEEQYSDILSIIHMYKEN